MSGRRNTDLSQVFFTVEQRPIFLESSAKNHNFFEVPRFYAILDVERAYVFSVVAEGYRLVSNREAVEMGKFCFRQVFSGLTATGMEVFNIITPSTRSFCHVDYVHKDGGFEPWQNDRWMPFLRITNSYNRMKPLRFDLGFCRWICTNGMIFGKKSITFQYVHTREDLADSIEFHMSFGDLKDLEKEFIEKLHNLKRFYVPEDYMLAIVCRVCDIRAGKEDMCRPRRRKQLAKFCEHTSSLMRRYVDEFGPNGYAALNVITELASRPQLGISPAAMVDQLQKRSGDWTDDFIRQLQDPKFDFQTYLGDSLKTAGLLAQLSSPNKPPQAATV